MTLDLANPTNRGKYLRGRTLMLSAAVPTLENSERYRRISNARMEIEEAIVSLARATFSEGGRLVFAGEESISLLLAMVGAEYLSPRFAESERMLPVDRDTGPGETAPMLTVYYPTTVQESFPEIRFLQQLGYIEINWISSERDSSQPSDWLQTRMIEETDPVAMVCIGGMEEMERDVRTFRELRSRSPIYVMVTTGGASEVLGRQGSNYVRIADQNVLDDLARLVRETTQEQEDDVQFGHVPYALIMQYMIMEIGGSDQI